MLGAASFCAQMTLGTTDRFTIMSDGYMILGTAGSAEMGFKNAQLMQMGNFGGYIKYYNKAVTSKVWGELDLLGGLVNFSLGKTENEAAIDALFRPRRLACLRRPQGRPEDQGHDLSSSEERTPTWSSTARGCGWADPRSSD